MNVFLVSRSTSPRLMYIARFLLEQCLGCTVIFAEREDTVSEEGITLTYGPEPGKQGIHIRPAGLLEEREILMHDVPSGTWNGEKTFFPTDGTLPFDLFSAAFYLLSRYEEYVPHRTDKHGRFAPEESILFKHGLLRVPILDRWLIAFRKVLLEHAPGENLPQRTFRHIHTVDVDTAYAFKGKGIIRTAGALTRSALSGKWDDFRERLQVISGRHGDPFDIFNEVIAQQKQYGFDSLFFFLLGDYGLNDKSVPHNSGVFQSLIKHVNDYAEVGIHTSYASTQQPDRIGMEVERLRQIAHIPVRKSRQHFLKIRLPQSYRDLIEYGITDDYSMAYAGEPGFRAGTCTPFPWYDLEREEETGLRIHPFAVMEATFRYYKEQSAEEALLAMQSIVDAVREVQGPLYTTWHNDALSDRGAWEGWKRTHDQLLAYIHEA